jgi:hypothetical protein
MAEHMTLVVCLDGTTKLANVPSRLIDDLDTERLDGIMLGLYEQAAGPEDYNSIKELFYLFGFCEPFEYEGHQKKVYAYWNQYVVEDAAALKTDAVLVIGWFRKEQEPEINRDEIAIAFMEAIETENWKERDRLLKIIEKDPELKLTLKDYLERTE